MAKTSEQVGSKLPPDLQVVGRQLAHAIAAQNKVTIQLCAALVAKGALTEDDVRNLFLEPLVNEARANRQAEPDDDFAKTLSTVVIGLKGMMLGREEVADDIADMAAAP